MADSVFINGVEYVPKHQAAQVVAPQAKRIPQPKMVECKCQWCKQPFMARQADVKRGWGKFCSKSCKAMKQEKRTGQYRAYQNGSSDPRERQLPDGSWEFCNAHLFSNEEHDCNKE